MVLRLEKPGNGSGGRPKRRLTYVEREELREVGWNEEIQVKIQESCCCTGTAKKLIFSGYQPFLHLSVSLHLSGYNRGVHCCLTVWYVCLFRSTAGVMKAFACESVGDDWDINQGGAFVLHSKVWDGRKSRARESKRENKAEPSLVSVGKQQPQALALKLIIVLWFSIL